MMEFSVKGEHHVEVSIHIVRGLYLKYSQTQTRNDSFNFQSGLSYNKLSWRSQLTFLPKLQIELKNYLPIEITWFFIESGRILRPTSLNLSHLILSVGARSRECFFRCDVCARSRASFLCSDHRCVCVNTLTITAHGSITTPTGGKIMLTYALFGRSFTSTVVGRCTVTIKGTVCNFFRSSFLIFHYTVRETINI